MVTRCTGLVCLLLLHHCRSDSSCGHVLFTLITACVVVSIKAGRGMEGGGGVCSWYGMCVANGKRGNLFLFCLFVQWHYSMLLFVSRGHCLLRCLDGALDGNRVDPGSAARCGAAFSCRRVVLNDAHNTSASLQGLKACGD